MQDTDLDGSADDGTPLGTEMRTFTYSIPEAGLLDLRVRMKMDSGDEEVAYDNIVVSGTLSGVTCDDENACNNGASGSCTYPDTNEDCLGNCLDGFPADCAGTCGGTAVADCAGTCGGLAKIVDNDCIVEYDM